MAKKDCSELSKAILDLALNIMADPDVKNIDEVVGEIQKSFPIMPANEIIDAIVDASGREAGEVDELAQKLARMKREARTHSSLREKIEDVEAYLDEGKPPEPPKPRQIGPDSIEELRKTSKNLRKWLTTADPQMRKTLEATLDRLDAQIESGEFVMDRNQEARLHEALQGIQDQINIARQKVAGAKAIKKVMDQIDTLNRHLEQGTLPAVKKQDPKGYGPLSVLREIRDDLKKQVARSEPAQLKQLKQDIADLEARIKAGDFAPRRKKVEIPQSKELQTQIYQRDRLRRDVRVAMLELKPKTIWGHIAEPFNAIRALKTSFDLSAVLRQGGFIGFAHPVRAARAIPDMLRAMVSEEASTRINSDILNRANAPLYARSKLYIAPIDGTERLVRMEEAYMSHLIERAAKSNIPILKQIGQGVEASERAYLTFLNKLRADSFDTMAATLAKNGEPTQKESEAIARFVNEATGRGSIGIEQAAVGLNTVFFAPKYTASRFQLLVGHPLWGGSNATRKLIAEEYARYLIGVLTVLVLGSAAGGEIELDPRSSDFLKIRFGKTRIDPMSGLSQSTVLLSRMTTATAKAFHLTDADSFVSTTTGKTRDLTFEDMGRFLRGKLSPTFGIPINVVMGKNVVGEKVTPVGAVLDAPVPLAFSDVYAAMKDQGIPAGSAMGILSIFGMSLQSYESNKKKKIKHTPLE